MKRPTRRQLLTALVAAAAIGAPVVRTLATASPPTPPAPPRGPGDGQPRFVLVLLRGAMDGLSTIVPHGDPRYADRRGALRITEGLVRLDDTFSLAPALAGLAPLWAAGELLPVHAVATPLRARSHFDAQDTLENGGTTPADARDGWLYRALASAGRLDRAMAVGRTVPLVLRGANTVANLDPDEEHGEDAVLLTSVAELWADDPLLGPALAERLRAEAILPEDTAKKPRDAVAASVSSAAPLLLAADGPRIVTLDLSGWDTHAGEAAALTRRLSSLSAGLVGLRDGLGDAWSCTAVLVVTEFGRTVMPNGTGGTDHGTGGAALLLGGAVRGGRVHADWPGLDSLYEDRDLRPTTDVRALQAAILRDHLGLGDAAVAAAFPGLRGRVDDLVRGPADRDRRPG